MNSFALWACGAAATGKSCICEAAVLPLDFVLIDVDQTYDELLKKYELSWNDIIENGENREYTKTLRYARRLAERLTGEEDANGLVDPHKFIASLTQAVRDNRIKDDYAGQFIDIVQTKIGKVSMPGDSFRKIVFPMMSDWDDPLDYLKDKNPVTRGHVLAVARELTRRRLVSSRNHKKNLLFVETGGQTGRLINLKKALETEGYHTFLLWFYLESVKNARRRNETRGASGGRSLKTEIIQRSFQVAKHARDQLVREFQPNTFEIDNTREGNEYIQAKIEQVRAIVQQWMTG